MEMSRPDLASVVRMSAKHVSAAGSRDIKDELVGVAVESTITIDVGGKMHFLLMCTPSDQRNLARVFCCLRAS